MSQIIKASILSFVFGLIVYSGVLLNVFEAEGDGHSHSHSHSKTAEHTEEPSDTKSDKKPLEQSHPHNQSETVEQTERPGVAKPGKQQEKSHTHDEHNNSDGHSH